MGRRKKERLGFKKLFYTFWLETVLQSVSYVILFESIFFQSFPFMRGNKGKVQIKVI